MEMRKQATQARCADSDNIGFSEPNSLSVIRKDIDELKAAIMDIRKCLVDLTPVRDETANKGNPKENGHLVKNETNSSVVTSKQQKKSNSRPREEKDKLVINIESENNELFKNLTDMLDSVVEYMENPRLDCKTNILASVRNMRGKLCTNGS